MGRSPEITFCPSLAALQALLISALWTWLWASFGCFDFSFYNCSRLMPWSLIVPLTFSFSFGVTGIYSLHSVDWHGFQALSDTVNLVGSSPRNILLLNWLCPPGWLLGSVNLLRYVLTSFNFFTSTEYFVGTATKNFGNIEKLLHDQSSLCSV